MYVVGKNFRRRRGTRYRSLYKYLHLDWQIITSTKDLEAEEVSRADSSILRCGEKYEPAAVLGLEDADVFLARRPKLSTPAIAARVLSHAVDFHLRRQHDDACFLVGSRDLLYGPYVWVVGFVQVESPRVLVIEDGIVYGSNPQDFGLNAEALAERFPATPRHYIDTRNLVEDYRPPSLETFQPQS